MYFGDATLEPTFRQTSNFPEKPSGEPIEDRLAGCTDH